MSFSNPLELLGIKEAINKASSIKEMIAIVTGTKIITARSGEVSQKNFATSISNNYGNNVEGARNYIISQINTRERASDRLGIDQGY
jgi:hypothetical protein